MLVFVALLYWSVNFPLEPLPHDVMYLKTSNSMSLSFETILADNKTKFRLVDHKLWRKRLT